MTALAIVEDEGPFKARLFGLRTTLIDLPVLACGHGELKKLAMTTQVDANYALSNADFPLGKSSNIYREFKWSVGSAQRFGHRQGNNSLLPELCSQSNPCGTICQYARLKRSFSIW